MTRTLFGSVGFAGLRNFERVTASTRMSSSMAVDAPKPAKFDIESFTNTALDATPADLHPFFESFRNLYNRK
jgi:hypothetical protein